MSSNKGITLVVLVITIILILMLASIGTYEGYQAIRNAEEQRFINQLKQISEAVNMHINDYGELGLVKEEIEKNGINYQYKLSSKEDYEKLGLKDTTGTVYVNFEKVLVYSQQGLHDKHTLADFGIKYYIPTTQTEEKIGTKKLINTISFEIKMYPQNYSWKYVILNESIKCEGNPEDGNLLYTEYNTNEWKRVNKKSNGYELEIKDPGIYQLKYRDSSGNESEIKQIYAYVKDGLKIYYDGEYNENYTNNSTATKWEDLSGNKNDGTINGCTWKENCLHFDGINNWVNCEIKNFAKPTYQTVASYDTTETGEYNIVSNSEGGFGLGVLNNKNFSEINVNGNNHKLFINTIKPNINYALTSKYDENTFTFFENNTINKEQIDENMTVPTDSTILSLGSKLVGSQNLNLFNGNIYTFRLYDRPLTDEEIQINYNIDKIRYNIQD